MLGVSVKGFSPHLLSHLPVQPVVIQAESIRTTLQVEGGDASCSWKNSVKVLVLLWVYIIRVLFYYYLFYYYYYFSSLE